jgi:hypothetical protein
MIELNLFVDNNNKLEKVKVPIVYKNDFIQAFGVEQIPTKEDFDIWFDFIERCDKKEKEKLEYA